MTKKSSKTPPASPPANKPAEPPPAAKQPLRLEYVEAGSLTPNPLNWRRHPAHQMAAIHDVLNHKEIGWAGALLFNERTGRLLDGHARQKSVAPTEIVPVLIGSWSEEAEKKILLTLDPIAGQAEADLDNLQQLLDQVTLPTDALQDLADSLLDHFADDGDELDDDRDPDMTSEGGGSGGGSKAIKASWQIVVNCRNEADQKRVYKMMTNRGYTCKVLSL